MSGAEVVELPGPRITTRELASASRGLYAAHLRRLDATSTWTVGICNGVALLGAAGLLRGRKATTNWFYQHRLAEYGVSTFADLAIDDRALPPEQLRAIETVLARHRAEHVEFHSLRTRQAAGRGVAAARREGRRTAPGRAYRRIAVALEARGIHG